MSKIDAQKLWSLHYRLLAEVIAQVMPNIERLGLEVKELFVLAEVDEYPNPAKLADRLCYPRPTVTVYLKRLEAGGLLKREIDTADLRRHRMILTPKGRKIMIAGTAVLAKAYGNRLEKISAAEQSQLRVVLEKMV